MKLLRVLGAALSILSFHVYAAPSSRGNELGLEESSATEVLRKFVSSLESFRSGADSDAEALLDLGRKACDQFDRCDVLELAQFYTSLSPGQRAAGLRHEEEFRGCWRRVRDAHSARLDEASWLSAREAILTELEDLGQRADALADPSPAARAWSLSSRLGVAELQAGTLSTAAAHDLLLECRERAERAEELFVRGGYVTPRLEPLWILARLDKLEGKAESARQGFASVLQLSRSVGNVDFQLHALSGLADLARERGDAHAVDQCLIRMAALRPPSAEGPGFQLVLRHAMRLIHQDEAQVALDFLDRHRPEDLASLSSWHLARASALTRMEELEAALEQWTAAEELADERSLEPSERWSLELARARIELSAGRYGQALRMLERGAAAADLDRGPQEAEPGERRRSPVPAEVRLELFAMRGEALLHLARHDAARRDLERALELASEINASLEPDGDWSGSSAGSSAARANVLGEGLGIHRLVLLAEANLLLGDALGAARVVESAQSQSLRRKRGKDAPIDLEAWATSIELGLVTWAIGPDESIVIEVLPRGRLGGVQASGRIVPVGRAQVARAVRRLREALLSDEIGRARRLGRELVATLFPLSRSQPLRRGRRLYSLHGPLEELPLEWLLAEGLLGVEEDAEDSAPSRTIPLVLPGLPAAHPGSPTGTPLRWTLLGDPRGVSDELLLPGALDELVALGELHPGALELRGPEFTRDAALAVLQLPPRGTGALHLATHLTVPPGLDDDLLGGDDGLLCSGGESLRADDLRRAAPRFRLAVLSACTTGGGRFIDGEGLHGVARALLAGGTRNVVVTLWPVEDRAAERFSLALHRSLLAGRAPSVAVHEARSELRDRGHAASDWAAFRLLGRD